MEAAERLGETLQKNLIAIKHARYQLRWMLFIGFVISGIVEHGVSVALLPSDLSFMTSNLMVVQNNSRGRRYCDAPNMTALAIYYDSSEEANLDDNYDFSQLQEMSFQVNLSSHEKVEFLLKKFYFWGSFVSPIPASRLAVKIGPKKVFGYSLLGAAASTILVPAAWMTSIHLGIRFFQGLFCGALIPSAHSLAINWFPPHQRNTFISLYSGTYIGYALCELMTVKVIQTLGSSSIHYITSTLTVIWFVPWSMMIFNTPDKHLKKIGFEKNPVTLLSSKTIISDFPLRCLICSRPVWMSMGVIFGSYCGQISINVGMRLYLKYIYGITDGFLSAVSYIVHSMFAMLCGLAVNHIQNINFVSVTSSRRMFVYISHFVPAGFLFVIGFVSCDSMAPVFLYTLAVIVSGAVYSGAISSTLDIAPNYAGTVVAFCCTFGAAGSILMIYLISSVLNGEVLGSWRLTFSLTSLTLLVSSIFFMLRGSGAVQSWNSPKSWESKTDLKIPKDEDKKCRPTDVTPLTEKQRTKSLYAMENKILRVLRVQEPERFTRVRAYSTSLPNERGKCERPNACKSTGKKRASIT